MNQYGGFPWKTRKEARGPVGGRSQGALQSSTCREEGVKPKRDEVRGLESRGVRPFQRVKSQKMRARMILGRWKPLRPPGSGQEHVVWSEATGVSAFEWFCKQGEGRKFPLVHCHCHVTPAWSLSELSSRSTVFPHRLKIPRWPFT